MSTACLYSVVKNTSGSSRWFGFLPNHGQRLDDDETMLIPGDLVSEIRRNPGRANRNFKALEAALRDGDLQIVSTPAPILQDIDNDNTVMLQVDNDTVELVDPCYVD